MVEEDVAVPSSIDELFKMLNIGRMYTDFLTENREASPEDIAGVKRRLTTRKGIREDQIIRLRSYLDSLDELYSSHSE